MVEKQSSRDIWEAVGRGRLEFTTKKVKKKEVVEDFFPWRESLKS